MAVPLASNGRPISGSLYLPPSRRLVLQSLCEWPQAQANVTVLTAGPGMGKTMLLQSALARLAPECKVVYTFWTAFGSNAFVAHLLSLMEPASASALGVQTPQSEFKSVLARLKNHGARLVIGVDEADMLSADALNALAELLDCDSADPPQVKLLLAGAPRLSTMLDGPFTLPMRRRVGSCLTLEPLGEEEMRSFVLHRMDALDVTPVDPRDLDSIAAGSRGIPRLLDRLCEDRNAKTRLHVVPPSSAQPPAQPMITQAAPADTTRSNAVERIAEWAKDRGTAWRGTVGELAISAGVSSEDAQHVLESAGELERKGIRASFRTSPGRPRMVILKTDSHDTHSES